MKRFILCVFFVVSIPSAVAAVPMSRFSRVIDSRTIVVERIDATEVVHLTNVDVPVADEQAARIFLERKLAGAWVYVENGNVYRSPDALFINRELAFGAYAAPALAMRVLGEVNPGPRPQAAPKPPPVRAPKARPAPRPRRAPRPVRRR